MQGSEPRGPGLGNTGLECKRRSVGGGSYLYSTCNIQEGLCVQHPEYLNLLMSLSINLVFAVVTSE